MAKLVSADLTGGNLCTLTYTTTDGEMLSLKEGACDAKIISHSYTDMGVIIFNGPITIIRKEAFANCHTLMCLTIPDSVTMIGSAAFGGCTSLVSVTIPNSVTSIERGAFFYCTSLTAFYGKFASEDNRCLIVDGVLNTFAIDCGLTTYAIPDSVTSIGRSAFRDCTSLTSVTIPNSVTSIGDWAFAYCI